VTPSAPPAGSTQAGVAYLIGRLDRVLRQQLGAGTAQFELTAAQYTALSALKTRGPQLRGVLWACITSLEQA